VTEQERRQAHPDLEAFDVGERRGAVPLGQADTAHGDPPRQQVERDGVDGDRALGERTDPRDGDPAREGRKAKHRAGTDDDHEQTQHECATAKPMHGRSSLHRACRSAGRARTPTSGDVEITWDGCPYPNCCKLVTSGT
jgi:hypothetical protein